MAKKQLPAVALVSFAVILAMGASMRSSAPFPDEWITTPSGQQLRVEPVATGLRTIGDGVWAPDGEMWVTQRGGTISRIDVRNGRVTDVGRIDVLERGESGLM